MLTNQFLNRSRGRMYVLTQPLQAGPLFCWSGCVSTYILPLLTGDNQIKLVLAGLNLIYYYHIW